MTKLKLLAIQTLLCPSALIVLNVIPFVSLSAQQPTPAMEGASNIALIPQPREMTNPSQLPLTSGIRISTDSPDASDLFTAKDLQAALEGRSIKVESEKSRTAGVATIELLKLENHKSHEILEHARLSYDEPMKPEGYILVPAKDGLTVIAATDEGLFYGAQTVKQLVVGNGSSAVHAVLNAGR